GAQKRRAEETSGALGRLAEQQKADAAEEAAEARSRIDVLQPFTVKLPLTGLPSNKVVLSAVDLAGGYTPGSPVFRGLCFEVRGPERVAVFGPNGSGKSTLLKTITGVLRPLSGEVRVNVSWALLDQEVSLLEGAGNILENFRKINPEADENACRAALARFRFRAGAALQKVATLSEGERLRAGLACVLGGASPPQLLILDEPTNHLDIASLEAVEAGLNAYDGALLVVSHDETFLERVGVTRHIPLR
ncbi:MAG: ABC transporter, partial [Hyphomonas sp. 32-62-5]